MKILERNECHCAPLATHQCNPSIPELTWDALSDKPKMELRGYLHGEAKHPFQKRLQSWHDVAVPFCKLPQKGLWCCSECWIMQLCRIICHTSRVYVKVCLFVAIRFLMTSMDLSNFKSYKSGTTCTVLVTLMFNHHRHASTKYLCVCT